MCLTRRIPFVASENLLTTRDIPLVTSENLLLASGKIQCINYAFVIVIDFESKNPPIGKNFYRSLFEKYTEFTQ